MPLSEILNTGVYALFIGLAAIGVLLGYVRGLSRQTIKFATVAVAFVVSLVCVKWLMNFVKKHNFKPFGIYRICLGLLVLFFFLFNR